jgi:hypothetical protein
VDDFIQDILLASDPLVVLWEQEAKIRKKIK